MAGGSWTPFTSKTSPGIFINFQNKATAQIQGGAQGIVGFPIKAFAGGTASVKTFYEVTTEAQASALFGSSNIANFKRILQGGASKVVVYTLPVSPTAQDYTDMRAAFDGRYFNVFCYDGPIASGEQTNTKTWVNANRNLGKHFSYVTGGTSAEDLNPDTGNTRSALLLDDYCFNVINGVNDGVTAIQSGDYACFIAGLIAATPINKAITYAQLPVVDVTYRLTLTEQDTAITSGSIALVHDGEKVKVLRGITTNPAGIKKIRTSRARQAIQNDLTKSIADNYVGKIDNNEDGQKSLISAVRAYLLVLANGNVIKKDFTVDLDTRYQSVGDEVYLALSITEVDSMEEIYFTIYV